MRFVKIDKLIPFILLVVGLIYANSLINGFVFDDYDVIVDNTFIRHLDNLPGLFNTDYFRSSLERSYRPTVTASYMFDSAIWGIWAPGFHLTNLVLHLITVLLGFHLLKSLGVSRAISALAALLYGIHPAASEAVNAIAFREDILMCLGILACTLLAVRALNGDRRKGMVLYALSFLFFAFALLSKEMAVVYPAMWLVLLFYRPWEKTREPGILRRLRPADWIYLGLISISSLLFVILQLTWLRDPVAAQLNCPGGSLFTGMLTMSKALLWYIQMLILPVTTIFHPAVWAGAGAVIIIAVIAWLTRKNGRTVPGLLWILIYMLPVSNIIPIYNPVAVRYLYLPLFGFCLALIPLFNWIDVKLRKRQPERYKAAAWILIAVLLIPAGGRTCFRNLSWQSSETLWEDETGTGRGLNNYGRSLVLSGDLDGAIAKFEEALELNPLDTKAMNNLGTTLKMKGELERPRIYFERAIKLNPVDPMGYNNMGDLLLALGKNEEARIYFAKAIEVQPGFVRAHSNMGISFKRDGAYKEAESWLKKSIELDPYNALAYYNLGVVYGNMKEYDKAEKSYKETIRLDPGLAEAHYNLGNCYIRAGKLDEALESCLRAIELKPDNQQFEKGLEWIKSKRKDSTQ
jgi:protein O-mannosyl-transferase